MKTKADRMLDQIRDAEKLGQAILEMSGLNRDGVIYTFATSETLIINCQDYATVWQFDEAQFKLRRAIAQVKSSIHTILLEKSGKTLYDL